MLMLAVFALGAALRLDAAGRSAMRVSPISRVAQLLEGLSEKVQQDEKAEQGLYDQYKCWCDKVINGKSASMDANEVRITELAAYIDDLTNGRIELTDERSTNEAEVKELQEAINDADVMRANELADYTNAKLELDQAVSALSSAAWTLGNATEDNPEALLASHYTTELRKAVAVGKGFLAKSDVQGLVQALEAPTVDYEKLNHRGNLANYTTRSTGIQDILRDMLSTFQDNRADAVANEEKAVTDYNTLRDGKLDQLEAAKQALLDKSGEGDARNVAKGEAETEKTDLEGQNSRDKTFVDDTKTACETKADEWEARRGLRQAEVKSINLALKTLRSDDAKDLFSKRDSRTTHKAAPAFFLQVNVVQTQTAAALAAARLLRKAGDARVTALATALTMRAAGNPDASNPFGDVLDEVDTMISTLRTEYATDESKRSDCASEQLNNTQSAKATSKAIDINTEKIDTQNHNIALHKADIAAAQAQLTLLAELKTDAVDQRANAAAEYATALADDDEAVGLIEAASKALKDFYADNGLSEPGALLQTTGPGEDPGDAPVTWGDGDDAAYTGASGAAGGIVGILGMIKTDIESDLADAKTAEDTAIAEHAQMLLDLDATKDSIETIDGDLDADVATAEGKVATEEGDRTGNQGDLQATLGTLDAMSTGCNWLRQNFDARRAARNSEIKGLVAAQTVLTNANTKSR